MRIQSGMKLAGKIVHTVNLGIEKGWVKGSSPPPEKAGAREGCCCCHCHRHWAKLGESEKIKDRN